MSDSDPDIDLQNRFITITVDPPASFELFFERMEGNSELGRPFRFDLELISTKLQLDLISMLGASLTVNVTLPDDTESRYYNGVIAAMRYDGYRDGFHRYLVELRPWIWLLSRIRTSAIYQNQTIPDIISAVFAAAGFSNQVQDKKSGTYVSWEYRVQYRETSLDFVTRLMEEAGIYYYFTHAAGQHTLVLADDPSAHSAADGAATIPFIDAEDEYRRTADHVWEWHTTMRLDSGAYTLRDYNFETPAADLTAKALDAGSYKYSTYEVYDYPGKYDAVADGSTQVNVRMQELTARREVLGAVGNVRALNTGNTFTLSEFTDESQNREYLVIASKVTLFMAEAMFGRQPERGDTFKIEFHAIPATTRFRLARQTPRPVVQGPQTARVVGDSGDEITTDQYGRIRLKFFWDRSDAEDSTASCWIRVSQPWAGANWGGILIPRIGQEVVVDFLEGDPDRPIVTGRVYNASTTVPYALPDNKTRSTLKSNSSTGGNGFNELRFEDKAGSEEVFIQAQKDLNQVVLNNQTVTVTQDMTTTVKQGNRAATVSQGNESLTVSQGNRDVTVSQGKDSLTVSTGDHVITVSTGKSTLTVSTGDHTIDVTAGNSTISAGTSITLKVGANSIKIDQSGITIGATMIKLSADATLQATASGPMTLQGAVVNIN